MPQPVAQMASNDLSTNLQQLVAKIPWGHNIMLMEKVKELSARLWYMQKTIEEIEAELQSEVGEGNDVS